MCEHVHCSIPSVKGRTQSTTKQSRTPFKLTVISNEPYISNLTGNAKKYYIVAFNPSKWALGKKYPYPMTG